MLRLRENWLQYSKHSTIGALSHISHGSSKNEQKFWILANCFAIFITIVQISLIIGRFLQFEIISTVETTFGETPFPAVTVCSVNGYKAPLLKQIAAFSNLFDAYDAATSNSNGLNQTDTDENAVNFEVFSDITGKVVPILATTTTYCGCAYIKSEGETKCFISGNIANASQQFQDIYTTFPSAPMRDHETLYTARVTMEGGYCPNPHEKCSYRIERCSKNVGFLSMLKKFAKKGQNPTFSNLQYLLRTIKFEERKKIEYMLKEILIECMIGDRKCDFQKDFDVFEDITYGLCYTFNGKNPSKFNISKAGPPQGLKMLLYTNMNEYTNFTQSYGVRVIIHDQEVFYFPESYGFFAPIHQYTSFSLKKTINERISYAHRKCVSKPESNKYLYPGGYTIEGCQRSCFQQKSIETCGCADPRYPLFEGNQTYCSVEDEAGRECLSKHIVTIDDEQCNCKSPCHEVSFTTTISSANLKLPVVLNHHEKIDASVAAYIYTEIFYETIHIEVLQEQPMYTFYSLISEIGAVIGFWLGMSVIGFLEGMIFLAEFSVGLLYYVDDYIFQKHVPPLPEVKLPKIAFFDPGVVPVKRDWDIHAQAYKSEIEKGSIQQRHKYMKQYHLLMGNLRFLRKAKKHYKCKICKVKARPKTTKRVSVRQHVKVNRK